MINLKMASMSLEKDGFSFEFDDGIDSAVIGPESKETPPRYHQRRSQVLAAVSRFQYAQSQPHLLFDFVTRPMSNKPQYR
jgi:hypothetical protein